MTMTMILLTYTEYSINAGIVATVAHGKPVEHKEHDVDVFPAEENMIVTVRGGIKKNCFFFQKNSERGGGGSRRIQNFLIRKN